MLRLNDDWRRPYQLGYLIYFFRLAAELSPNSSVGLGNIAESLACRNLVKVLKLESYSIWVSKCFVALGGTVVWQAS